MITKKEFTEHSLTSKRQGKDITLSTGKLAPHSEWAVTITFWETSLLVTAIMEKDPDESRDFMPLAIDFRESRYAAGKIGGGRFNKREWRPSDEAVLYCRLTDRPLRPMFPKGMINDTVITISPLSLDGEISPGELSIIWSSAALMMAGIPFEGPVGACRIGYVDGEYKIHMTDSEAKGALLDLHLAGKKWSINMIEAAANECDPEILKEAMKIGQWIIDEICDIQTEFLSKLTITPQEPSKNIYTPEMFDQAKNILWDKMVKLQEVGEDKKEFDKVYAELSNELGEALADDIADENSPWTKSKLKLCFFALVKDFLRTHFLKTGVRVDGRWAEDIRQIYCEIDAVPRAHGAWLFWRWDTQVMSFLSLGWPSDAQLLDNMEYHGEEKRFIHHYKMPPFSNNEARMIRGTNRRETGHGRLAEKALLPMIPGKDVFPYTIRLVSEVLGSGWSTSMAAVCGSTLAMMSGWVPMKAPVSGIAMGMMSDDDQQVILTDIKGTEDFIGDMDFKLTGTSNGVTAIQMDTKLKWVKVDKLLEMVDRSNSGRQDILDYMLQTIEKPAEKMSPYAPSIEVHKIKAEQVRKVIGPGWSMITKIIEESWGPELVNIDFEDDGSVFITAKDQAAGVKARDMIQEVLREPTKGEQMEWKITRTEQYGVFVEIKGWNVWLVHVKNLWEWFIEDASALHKVWETMKVEVMGMDKGKLQLKKAE